MVNLVDMGPNIIPVHTGSRISSEGLDIWSCLFRYSVILSWRSALFLCFLVLSLYHQHWGVCSHVPATPGCSASFQLKLVSIFSKFMRILTFTSGSFFLFHIKKKVWGLNVSLFSPHYLRLTRKPALTSA